MERIQLRSLARKTRRLQAASSALNPKVHHLDKNVCNLVLDANSKHLGKRRAGVLLALQSFRLARPFWKNSRIHVGVEWATCCIYLGTAHNTNEVTSR
jgi:hypothetical protein